jgi:Holliday junction resolvase RusA-like endonuclease
VILYSCTLPFSVSVNQLYAGGSGQKRFKGKKYVAWLKSCPQLRELNIDEPVSVEYIFTWPDNRARDGQNYMKCCLDYLVSQKVIKSDDWKIVAKELWRHVGISKADSRVELIIRSILPHTQNTPSE